MTVANNRRFRSDINGLRAWAVMAVVFYHFAVPGVYGGYAGVDVFFVISGYLMCGIIYSGLEQGKFSLSKFYLARARRIFPALIVVCAVSLVFGWFFLMSEEYKQLGRHVRESLTFTSNLRYLKESGYFDVASQEKWLLHTWSLSVEWQFYMLLPVVMLLFTRVARGRSSVFLLLSLMFLGSLVWCIWITDRNAAQAFYTLQARAWEMLAGAMVFMVGKKEVPHSLAKWMERAGFALIVTAFLVFEKQTVWPGWKALLPVIGSMLVLLAGRERSAFTSGAVAQWLGTRSYSIYLWHWPLVVALAYTGLLATPGWVLTAIIMSLGLGHLSYVLVEVPTRDMLSKRQQKLSAVMLVSVLAGVAVLAQQVRTSGFPERLPPEVAAIEAESKNHNPRLRECLDPESYCIYGDAAEPLRAVVIGDSHADAVVTAIEAALPGGHGSLLFRGGSGCMVVFGMYFTRSLAHCNRLNELLEQEHASIAPGVPAIIFGRTSKYVNEGRPGEEDKPNFHFGRQYSVFTDELLDEFSERYVDTLCALSEHRAVYVVRPIPEMPVDVPTLVGRGLLFGEIRNPSLLKADYAKRHAYVNGLQDEAAVRCGVKVLDPLPYLCDDSACYGGSGGRPIYRDQDHLSEYGNRLLVPLFERFFSEGLGADKAENISLR